MIKIFSKNLHKKNRQGLDLETVEDKLMAQQVRSNVLKKFRTLNENLEVPNHAETTVRYIFKKDR